MVEEKPSKGKGINFGNKLLSELFQVKVDIDMPVSKFIENLKQMKVSVFKTFLAMEKMSQERGLINLNEIIQQTGYNVVKNLKNTFADAGELSDAFTEAVITNYKGLFDKILEVYSGIPKDLGVLSAEQLENLRKTTIKILPVLEEANIGVEDAKQLLEDINNVYIDLTKTQEDYRKTNLQLIQDKEELMSVLEEEHRRWIDVKDSVISLVSAYGLLRVWDVAKEVEEFSAKITLMGNNMVVNSQFIEKMSEDMLEMARNYQVGANVVGEIANRFAELGRTAEEIKVLTKITLQYHQILGLSTDEASEFIDTQTSILKLNPKAIEDLGSAMLSYAKATKITTTELANCLTTHKNFLRLLKGGEIRESAQKDIMAVSSLYKELGVAPDEISGIMDSIIDITDQKSYLLLSTFSNFGEQARDMILSGKVEEVFTDMAKNISNYFRGMSQRDKAYWIDYYSSMTGISKDMLIALSDTTSENIDAVVKKMQEGLEKSKPLQETWEEWRKTTGQLQERLKELVNTALAKFVLPTLTFFGKILGIVVGALSQFVKIIGVIPKPIRIIAFSIGGLIVVYASLMSTLMLVRGTLLRLGSVWLAHSKIIITWTGKLAKSIPFIGGLFNNLNKQVLSKDGIFGGGIKSALGNLTLGLKSVWEKSGIGKLISVGVKGIFGKLGGILSIGFKFIKKIFWRGLTAIPILGWILLGISLLPLLNKYILEPLIKVFGGEKALEKWRKFWKSAFGWIIDIGKKIWGAIKTGFSSVFDSVKAIFVDMWGSIKEVWGAFSEVFSVFKEIFVEVLKMFGLGKKDSAGFGNTLKIITKVIAISVKIAFMPLIITLKGIALWFKLVAKVVKFFITPIKDLVLFVKDFIKMHSGLIKIGKTIFMYGTPLGLLIRLVVFAIKQFKVLWQLVKDIFSGKNIFEAFKKAIKSTFGNLWKLFGFDKLAILGKLLVKKFKNIWQLVKDIFSGKNIFDSLKKAIKSTFGNLWKLFGFDKLTELGKSLLKKFGEIFLAIGKFLKGLLADVFPFNILLKGLDAISGLFGGNKGKEKTKEITQVSGKKEENFDIYEKAQKFQSETEAMRKEYLMEKLAQLSKSGLNNLSDANQKELVFVLRKLLEVNLRVAQNTGDHLDLKKKELDEKTKELPEPMTGMTDILSNFNTSMEFGG